MNKSMFVFERKDLDLFKFKQKLNSINLESCTIYCAELYVFPASSDIKYPSENFDLNMNKSVMVDYRFFMFLDHDGVYGYDGTVEYLFEYLFEEILSNNDGYYLNNTDGSVYHDFYVVYVWED